ncbi:unnamed protein product [Caenorhabditis brenneri]
MLFPPKSWVLCILAFSIIVYLLVVNECGWSSDINYYSNSKQYSNELTTSKQRYLSSRLGTPTRLGNHLFELSSILGIARSLNRTPVFFIEDNGYKKELLDTNQTIPGLIDQFLIINGKMNPRVLENINDKHIHLTGTLYQSFKYFPKMRDEQLRWLKKPTNDYAGLPKSDEKTHVTCVHARRGDFLAVGFQAADDHFIREALKYIEKKENIKNRRKVIVIFGDDVKFMKAIFNDTVLSNDKSAQNSTSTHFVSQNSPSDDMVYSKSNCEVVLISASHSSFGWWIGYFSLKNRVYYMDMRVYYVGALKVGKINIHDYFMPHWTPLKFAADNQTIVIGDK